MHDSLLEILRCPYCGTSLSLVENDALLRNGPHVESGILGCECCAFPIVDGIPVLMADDLTRSAIRSLEDGPAGDALIALLGLDEQQAAAFVALRSTRSPATYLETLAILSHDAEADYLAYRLSDPTYLTSEAVIRALAQERRGLGHRALDVCGGAGHLTRVLSGVRPPSETDVESGTVLLDLSFWKLWLAARFTSPGCAPVCCDANHPLPFARNSFSTALLSDAFPYIWHKRLLADELMRLVGLDGLVVMPHLHSARGDNFSAGDTLTPEAHHDLLAPQQPSLFSDGLLLENLLAHRRVDLSHATSPRDLGDEPSFTLVASRDPAVFREYEVPDESGVTGELRVNPLYRVERRGESSILTLTFPTPEYAEEFAECRRYLPESLTARTDLTGLITPSIVGSDYAELRRRRVLLDAPRHYC
jgi:uncharacterized protein YbaR (Trm112 family)